MLHDPCTLLQPVTCTQGKVSYYHLFYYSMIGMCRTLAIGFHVPRSRVNTLMPETKRCICKISTMALLLTGLVALRFVGFLFHKDYFAFVRRVNCDRTCRTCLSSGATVYPQSSVKRLYVLKVIIR